MTSDLPAYLDAQLAAIEDTARAATPGPWDHWHVLDDGRLEVYVPNGTMDTECILEFQDYTDCEECHRPNEADAAHIAKMDPTFTLAWCAAIRAVIEDIAAETHEVVEDCWYTCAAATEERDGGHCCDDARDGACDCGRDARVNRRLRLLAQPFAGGEGWQEGWAL